MAAEQQQQQQQQQQKKMTIKKKKKKKKKKSTGQLAESCAQSDRLHMYIGNSRHERTPGEGVINCS